MKLTNNFITSLTKLLPKYIKYILQYSTEFYLIVSPYNIHNLLYFLKHNTNTQYKLLVDISSVDFPERNNRFEINYHLLSIKYNHRINIKTYANELLPVSSVSSIYCNAVWSEREIWDLFGIFFSNNNDLRRILTDYGFEGHPLRKDFPLSGYFEIRYDDKYKQIVQEPLEITQEYRYFEYSSPWK